MSARDPRAVVSRRSLGVRMARLAWILALALLAGGLFQASADEAAAWSALRAGGHVALMRHADAPGGAGDPPGFRLGDCATQRNLNAQGREESRRLGEEMRRRGVAIGAVLSSQWCRTRETARLAFGDQVRDEPAFNSFFGQSGAARERQTADARALIARWRGPGTLVVVTHQVNITALTGLFPASGEGIVLARRDGELTVVGRIIPGP